MNWIITAISVDYLTSPHSLSLAYVNEYRSPIYGCLFFLEWLIDSTFHFAAYARESVRKPHLMFTVEKIKELDKLHFSLTGCLYLPRSSVNSNV